MRQHAAAARFPDGQVVPKAQPAGIEVWRRAPSSSHAAAAAVSRWRMRVGRASGMPGSPVVLRARPGAAIGDDTHAGARTRPGDCAQGRPCAAR